MELDKLVLTPPQMRTAELAASAHGVDVKKLMDNAGETLGRRVLTVAQKLMKDNIVFLCGSGNNGGDGYVAVDFLLSSAAHITVVRCGEPKTDLAKAAFALVKKRCEIISLDEAVDSKDVLSSAGVIVDCVFGIGFTGELSSDLQRLFLRAALSDAYKISCDVPSGINSLNGRICPNTFEADETITFHKPKLGMLLSPAKECCGKVTVADIGIGDYVDEYCDNKIFTTDKAFVSSLLPYRTENAHKGIFGRVTLVCGSRLYPGAAMIAAASAMRSGVGMVNLCCAVNAIPPLASSMPECTYTPVPCDTIGFFSPDAIDSVMEQIDKSEAAVIGCGLGFTDSTKTLVHEIIRRSKTPLILDADGINCISGHIDILKEKQTEIVLTPHPTELARLCGTDTQSVMQDLFGHACEIANQYGVVVHAKNTQTLTVIGDQCYLTDFGCSALSKGGSGDMLAGLIGGLAAQGIATDRACVLADYIMGTSARELCRDQSPRGVLASDIIARFPRTFFEMEHE
ncbi:MAG: NAD(P)H-hydrate dehydratase [Ruminococcus sp.]|nr:NAD(P)H-hydrate dehydratase [Ruminococcus sp.]